METPEGQPPSSRSNETILPINELSQKYSLEDCASQRFIPFICKAICTGAWKIFSLLELLSHHLAQLLMLSDYGCTKSRRLRQADYNGGFKYVMSSNCLVALRGARCKMLQTLTKTGLEDRRKGGREIDSQDENGY